MDKRGQVTLFVVLGIVIILVFAFIYLVQSGNMQTRNLAKSFGLVSDQNVVKDFVNDCVEETGRNALIFIGLQGGYLEPKNYAEREGIKISYGYYEKKNTLITRNGLENEIKKYYELFLPECINGLKDYNLVKDNITAKVNISDLTVNVNARYLISIVKGDSKVVVNPQYNAKYKIRLGEMLDIADNIVRKTFGRENIIDMEYFYSIGNEFNVQIADESDTRIYMITDKRHKLDGANYTFMFAEKF